MIQKERTTDSLEHITVNICKNDQQTDIIRNVLASTLALYQWHYQTATDHQQYVNAESGASKAIDKTIELLRNKGHDTLADEVEIALYNDAKTSTYTKKKVLSQAKKHMQELLVGFGPSIGEYNKHFAKYLEYAFTEWCNKYPLDEAPKHFDDRFEPPIY